MHTLPDTGAGEFLRPSLNYRPISRLSPAGKHHSGGGFAQGYRRNTLPPGSVSLHGSLAVLLLYLLPPAGRASTSRVFGKGTSGRAPRPVSHVAPRRGRVRDRLRPVVGEPLPGSERGRRRGAGGRRRHSGRVGDVGRLRE